ncbi:MAG: GatB/YqeY domain-containing protein [Bacteroidales bacterium]|jgi:uncharacterized protein YqeY|nr:GatB/YqeY domain-containing protein [Bacteroidales bacterium]
MNLFDQITADIKTAMLAREPLKLDALRGIKKEFLEAKTAKGGDGELSDETAIKILTKMVKQRKDAADIYTQQNRPELAEKELAEATVITAYLPKQLSETELETIIKQIISDVNAEGAKDMGKVMGIASKQSAGKAEGRMISEMVKRLLS